MAKRKEQVQRYGINHHGRDLAVGDIHGHFSKLMQALIRVNFDPRVDRLFGTGDLVDRGDECHLTLKWLNYAWFKSVCGNHDDYVVRYDSGETGSWLQKAGKWFSQIAPHLQSVWAHVFDKLPTLIEVETPNGLIGIVHAECVLPDWNQLVQRLESPESSKDLKLVRNSCIWSRRRMEFQETDPVAGVRAVVVGHNPVKEVTVLGNVYHIDTYGWKEEGHFTLLNLHTLQVEPTSA